MQPIPPLQTFLRAVALTLVGAACGLAANAGLSPKRIPWFENWEDKTKVQAEQAGAGILTYDQALAAATGATHMIFDARKAELFDQGHLPGAMSLPVIAFADKFIEYHPVLQKEDPILVYCSGKECDESIELARKLKEQGYTSVSIYLGGFEEWKEKGGPVE